MDGLKLGVMICFLFLVGGAVAKIYLTETKADLVGFHFASDLQPACACGGDECEKQVGKEQAVVF